MSIRTTFHRFVIWNVVLVYEKLSQFKLCSEVDVSSLDLFDVSLPEMFLPNRTVEDSTIEVLETDIPVTRLQNAVEKKNRKNSIFEYY